MLQSQTTWGILEVRVFFLFFLGFCVLNVANGQAGDIGDDTACLSGFKASVQDTQKLLSTWEASHHAPPCNGSISSWNGVTCDNDRVFSVVLSNSGLGGSISSTLSRCSALNTLDLSANQLTGEIPATLGELSNLVSLNLSDNQLSGSIPGELKNCNYLNSLDLHGNQLEGPIPVELGSLARLQAFDVSDNGLSGPIPGELSYGETGAPRFNASSFDGNKDLFGFPLPPANRHTFSVLEIVGIGLASGVLSLIVSFTGVCMWLRMSERRLAAEEGKISELMTEPC